MLFRSAKLVECRLSGGPRTRRAGLPFSEVGDGTAADIDLGLQQEKRNQPRRNACVGEGQLLTIMIAVVVDVVDLVRWA
mgnify:CR=1 FL=1